MIFVKMTPACISAMLILLSEMSLYSVLLTSVFISLIPVYFITFIFSVSYILALATGC